MDGREVPQAVVTPQTHVCRSTCNCKLKLAAVFPAEEEI